MTTADQNHGAIELRADAATREIIDVSDGIDRIMGDRGLYGRMLTRFRRDCQNGVEPIRAALAAGDRLLAHRLAHTLKGAAGMIGAHALQRQASALEAAIRTGAPTIIDELDALAPALAQVRQALDELLSVEPGAPAVAARPLLDDSVLLAQLCAFLISGDGAAIDLLEESGASLKAILGEAGLQAVSLAANEFDYDGALDALRRVVEGRGEQQAGVGSAL